MAAHDSDTQPSTRLVVLLREMKRPSDPYQEVIEANGYSTEFIPVLDFESLDRDGLVEVFSQHENYSGLIFTSQVAVETVWSNVIGTQGISLSNWRTLPVFVVGKATKDIVETKLDLKCIGENSGNGELLAQFIIQYYDSVCPNQRPSTDRPLLFPCGNIRKDSLPKALSQASIPLHCQTCYETVPHPLINERIEKLKTSTCDRIVAVVFFSPSGVSYAFNIIKQHLLHPSPCDIKFCAIGPSTGECLKKECSDLSIPVHVASKPNPTDLLLAINQ